MNALAMLRQVLPLLAVVAILLVLAVRMRGMRARQDRLWQETPLAPGEVRFRVHVRTPSDNERWMRVDIARETGFIGLTPQQVSVHTIDPDGRRRRRDYDRERLVPRWIGNTSLRSGNLHWFALGGGDNEILVSADTGLNAAGSRQATADIFSNLSGGSSQFPGAREFALETHRGTLLVLVLMAVCAGYGLADFLGNPFELVGPTKLPLLASLPLLWMGLVGVLAYQALNRSGVPARESMVLGYLLAMISLCAALPLAKRLDTWTAREPMREIAYVMSSEGRFKAVDTASPDLDLRAKNGYWRQFDAGSRHSFRLQHGGLGLWQMDPRELDDTLRAYSREHPAPR